MGTRRLFGLQELLPQFDDLQQQIDGPPAQILIFLDQCDLRVTLNGTIPGDTTPGVQRNFPVDF
jgi:hypothetical protein